MKLRTSTFLRNLSAFSAFFLTGIAVSLSAPPTTQAASCLITDDTYSAIANVTADSYDVYVKLSQLGQLADVTVSTGEAAACRTIGATTASGNEWVKAGSIRLGAGDTRFNLTSRQLDTSYEYDRPTILLISQTTPQCLPSTECFITISDQQAALQPSHDLPDTGTLDVFYPKNSSGKAVLEVRYYVDGVFMYKTAQLESFDEKAIPYDGKLTSRVIVFEDGQTAVIDEPVPIVHSDTLGAMILRTARKYQTLLLWITILIAIVAAYYSIHQLIIAFEKRQAWLHAHGFIKDPPSEPMTRSRLAHLYTVDRVKRVIKGLGVVALLGALGVLIVIALDSYIVRPATVSGSSMEQSLKNGQTIFIDKTGVTISLINQTNFVPKRGQVVAAYSTSRFVSDDQIREDDVIIKRVIGLPGERVVIEGSTVTIYNSLSPDGFDPEANMPWLRNVVRDMSPHRLDIKLTNDELFVMGDNRPGSIDSRENGPLNVKDIIGVVHE